MPNQRQFTIGGFMSVAAINVGAQQADLSTDDARESMIACVGILIGAIEAEAGSGDRERIREQIYKATDRALSAHAAATSARSKEAN